MKRIIAAAIARGHPAGRRRVRRQRQQQQQYEQRRVPGPDLPIVDSIGAGEGALNLIVWAGYAEDGSTDPKVDWVTPFEKSTGCQVNAKTANTSDEMVTLMRTGRYDGVSASGNASVRLIAGGDVVPIDTKILTNYANIDPLLKNQSYNSVNGKMYGAPHGWGANLLMWNTKDVKTAPDSWGVVFDPTTQQGQAHRVRRPDLHRRRGALPLKTQPDLKITNPYELTRSSSTPPCAAEEAAAADRAVLVRLHEAAEPRSRRATSSWGRPGRSSPTCSRPTSSRSRRCCPKEGSTGWSDTWMLSSKAQHPNCMAKWMNWIETPEDQAQVAEWFGEAPANLKACDQTADKAHCDTFKAGDKRSTTRSSSGRRRRELPRQPRQPVRGLLQVGPGLDGDQGLTRHAVRRRTRCPSHRADSRPGEPPPARRALLARPRAARRVAAGAPLGWLGVVYLGLARRPVRHVVLDAERLHRPDRQGLLPRQLPDDLRRARLPQDRAAHGLDRGAGDGHRHRAGVPDRVLHGAGGDGARRRALLVVAVLMPLWASYLVKVYSWRTMFAHDGVLNWLLDPFGLTSRRPATCASGS